MSRREGDWDCASCQHLNFAHRNVCQQCAQPKPDGGYAGQGSQLGSNGDRKPGDWDCPSCQHMNFARRDSCRSCGTLKEGIGASSGAPQDGTRNPDWSCMICSFSNFGRNTNCLKCGNHRPTMGAKSGFAGSKAVGVGDWACTCGELVFASRFACRKCGSPRPYGGQSAGYPSQSYASQQYAPYGQQRNPTPSYGGGYSNQYAGSYGQSSGPRRDGMFPGDWVCTCGEHVFAKNDACRKCGALKPQPASGSYQSQQQLGGRPQQAQQVRPGDWECECSFNNFSTRLECLKCKKAKPMGL